jgi:hypothetical protein
MKRRAANSITNIRIGLAGEQRADSIDTPVGRGLVKARVGGKFRPARRCLGVRGGARHDQYEPCGNRANKHCSSLLIAAPQGRA